MLVTKQKVFRKFWYPVVPIEMIGDQPFAFTLLEEPLVIWRMTNGEFGVIKDRCCHRSAKLSKGKIINNCLACAYHGWRYNQNGQVVFIPQLPTKTNFNDYYVPAYKAKKAYGYVWVSLDKNPIMDVPLIFEAYDPSFRLITEFYETWHCSGLRVMENELDLAHPAFVHTQTFGHSDGILPEALEVKDHPQGLEVYARLKVSNPNLQKNNLQLAASETYRYLQMIWFMPFTCKLDIRYENGLRHIIVNTMTPINDHRSQMVQFCLRNDRDEDVSKEAVIAFDRLVTLEDKEILESTDPNVPLDHLLEKQLFTDKPGIMMRRKLLQLLQTHHEFEVKVS